MPPARRNSRGQPGEHRQGGRERDQAEGQVLAKPKAFGNVGGVLFLTMYSVVTPRTFFEIAALTAVVGVVLI